RKRKAHSKSRSGCGNCKLRRVKCDEAKPQCKTCVAFGVACNYGPRSTSVAGELVLCFDGASLMDSPPRSPVSMDQTILSMVNQSLQESPSAAMLGGPSQVYNLRQSDLDALNRFHQRSILSLGTEKSKWILQAETPRLACLHPFLMHLVLTFTLMHDRVSQTSDTNFTPRELYHYYTGTAMFNQKLCDPDATPSERDACWIASTLIGIIYICHIDATKPQEAWPLKSPGPGEPDWLVLSLGKQDLWEFCDPMRPDCCFQEMHLQVNPWGGDEDFTPDELKDGGFPNILPEILEFLNLTDPSTWVESPYFRSTNILSQLLPQDYNQQNIMKFATFTYYTSPEFRDLWKQKDPGVLILVAYWYSKAISTQFWWMWKRAVLECQAICIYLEKYHSDVPHLEYILRLPK
ncbi:hypothetical protein M406DRAFT_220339, partial [Cryphonectria parasitica EP155]